MVAEKISYSLKVCDKLFNKEYFPSSYFGKIHLCIMFYITIQFEWKNTSMHYVLIQHINFDANFALLLI